MIKNTLISPASIIESSDDAIISKTLEGVITSWNPGAERLLGYTAAEIIGKPVLILIPPERQFEEDEILTRLKKGECIQHYETVRMRKDGTRIDISLTISPIKNADGRIIGASKIARDITKQKLAERKLKESEQRFEKAFNSSPLILTITSLVDGRLVEVNDMFTRISGYTREEVIGKTTIELGLWSNLEDREQELEVVRTSGRVYNAEYSFRTRNGEELFGLLSAEAIEINGEPCTLTIIQNITERKLAEMLLRENEERHRLALDAGQIGTWDWDVIHNQVVWSDLVYEFHGIKIGEFGGRVEDFVQFLHFEDHDRVTKAINAALQKKAPYSIETRLIWKNGEVHWIATKGKVFFDSEDRPIRMIGATVDITARKQAEERQRLLWEAAGILLASDSPDSMLQGIFAQVGGQLGLDTYFNYMVDESGDSLQLRSYTGISKGEIQKISALKFGEGISGNVALKRTSSVCTSIQDSNDPMVMLAKHHGIRAYACYPLVAGERLIGTLSFASRTREDFSILELEFFETISRYITVAYERLNFIERLREADRRKDEFLAMLAHELRNPLAPIRNAVEILKRISPSDPKLQWPKEVIDRQVNHMTRLVDDLLDVSRITRGKIELRKEHLDLRSIVERALETSRPWVDAKNHQLNVSLPSSPLLVEGDATRLAQILSNLIHNAAKYTDEGGCIHISMQREGQQIATHIRDNGVGIPAETLAHVFELFSQAERSIDRAQGGLGIGLTVVKGLVEMHGGRVIAESGGPGQGSEFSVYLPLAKKEPSPISYGDPEIPPHHTHSSGRRILVVDDNADSATSMALLLVYSGHEVKTAFHGISAIQMAREFQPHVVLLDIGLPGMNGYDVAHELKKEAGTLPMTLIAITGYGQTEDRNRSKEAGFDHHLTKPVDHEMLSSLIDSLILDDV